MTEKSTNQNIDATVESVVKHLINLKNNIENITIHIEWKDGVQGVYGNNKTVDEYAMAAMMIQQFALQTLRAEDKIEEDNPVTIH